MPKYTHACTNAHKLTQTHLKAHTNACKTHRNTYPHKLCNNTYKRM